ncbi:hypothetical protein CQW23_19474 [Capsicum baccatum]|uniref:Uncharacterized protein n=1 Tax=Capsicum baccatum TaxID=33114 RepID=A0A2G2W5W7_CAPBA|nr:hypothetical protein CQW23_19474 [Capsicum baccatum]
MGHRDSHRAAVKSRWLTEMGPLLIWASPRCGKRVIAIPTAMRCNRGNSLEIDNCRLDLHRNAVSFSLLYSPRCGLILIVHPSLVPTNRELKMSFFLTLRSVQILSDPKVIDRIKMELFGETTIIRKIILEGGLIVVDGLSGDRAVGGGSCAAVGANDALLKYLK